MSAMQANSVCFIGELDRRPVATGGLSIRDGVALLPARARFRKLESRAPSARYWMRACVTRRRPVAIWQ